jgi:multiple sugar transport system permease protein
MTSNLLFAVGTLLTWTGWLVALRALYLAGQYFFKVPGVDRDGVRRGLIISGIFAALTLATGAALPSNAEPVKDSTVTFPLMWVVMPFVGWLALTSLIMVGVRTVQAWLALNRKERLDRLAAAAIWVLVGAASLWLFRSDPDNKFEIIRGGIPLSFNLVVTILLLAVAAVLAMVAAAKWASGRTIVSGITAQVALIAGSIVFGLPFAFLVITSFKEDRDMSSAHGIIWVPRVQETVPYHDPKNPLYEGRYEGNEVTGTISDKSVDGQVRVSIETPMSVRGRTFETTMAALKEVPRDAKLVTAKLDGAAVQGRVLEELEDGGQKVEVLEPSTLKGRLHNYKPGETEPVRHIGLRWQNYSEALSFLPPETNNGLVYVKNTLLIVIFSVIGTILSSSIVAYAFSRMKFPGKNAIFAVLLSTMMLPAAVTMLPQFLIFRQLGWIDTLYPLWVPAFFASAFNVFLLRQFFMQIPMELEDAAKIDGASYLRTFWQVMLPQVKPALAVIAIGAFMGAWNNFMGPLIYINSPENMPLSYALQLFQGDRAGEPGLLMAFVTMTVIPVLLLFFFAQRYFIENVTLSGLGGR